MTIRVVVRAVPIIDWVALFLRRLAVVAIKEAFFTVAGFVAYIVLEEVEAVDALLDG